MLPKPLDHVTSHLNQRKVGVLQSHIEPIPFPPSTPTKRCQAMRKYETLALFYLVAEQPTLQPALLTKPRNKQLKGVAGIRRICQTKWYPFLHLVCHEIFITIKITIHIICMSIHIYIFTYIVNPVFQLQYGQSTVPNDFWYMTTHATSCCPTSHIASSQVGKHAQLLGVMFDPFGRIFGSKTLWLFSFVKWLTPQPETGTIKSCYDMMKLLKCCWTI